MYYSLILLSTVLFGVGFAFQDLYRTTRGVSGLKLTMEISFVGGLVALLLPLITTGFALRVDGFTVLMAVCSGINSFLFSYCAFLALGKINLSLFSLFSMLGGMMIPFFLGILFYGEPFTVEKIVCVVFLCAAILLTLERSTQKGSGSGAIYCAGIFVFNGLSGAFSKLYSEGALVRIARQGVTESDAVAELSKIAAGSYTFFQTVFIVIVSGVLLATVLRTRQKERAPYPPRAAGIAAAAKIINLGGNLILTVALAYVDASVQYPMVTGGTMIVSAALAFLSAKKPKKRELYAIGVAFLGLLALWLIPKI